MTGFARVEGAAGRFVWALEAKSVNGKSLDLRARLPAGYEFLEPLLRQAAQRHLTRGNVQALLQLEQSAERMKPAVNEAYLEELLRIAGRLAERGLAPASADGLLAIRGVLESADELPVEEAERAERDGRLAADADALFAALAEQRQREGEALGTTLRGHLDAFRALVTAAADLAAAQPAALKARLAEQVALLLEASPALPPERLAQEAALLATKADVREELDRLGGHLVEVARLLDGGGAVGRKLDFLCQELNREANTLCAKSADMALTRVGLEMKSLVDQIREQVQNVE